jgi:hypothetical protein
MRRVRPRPSGIGAPSSPTELEGGHLHSWQRLRGSQFAIEGLIISAFELLNRGKFKG